MSQSVLVFIVLVGLVWSLVKERFPAAVSFLFALGLVLALGIIDTTQALSGFSNEAILLVGSLFVLARAVEKSQIVENLVGRLMGRSSKPRVTIARMVTPVIGTSAFLNNTPIVAMLIPIISRWANKHRQSPSLFLMPLSFAALLGGVITLIGTSTNIVVSGLMQEAGLAPIGFFEITKIGLPIAVLGACLLIILTPVLLPRRRAAHEDIEETVREFVVRMSVDLSLDGKTISQAKLRNLKGAYLAEIYRGQSKFTAVAPDFILKKDDLLVFAGRADYILELQTRKGLHFSEDDQVAKLDRDRSLYFEAVIGVGSSLVGKTIKQVGFRYKYQGAVLAIHRGGRRLNRKPGAVKLEVGDTLLIAADEYFKERWSNRRDFLVVYNIDYSRSLIKIELHNPSLILILIGMIVLAASGLVPLVGAVLLGALACVVTGVLTADEARSAIDFDLLIIIGSAISLATAVTASGLTTTITEVVTSNLGALGDVGILAGIIVATIILTAFVTNTAAAALMFPIAVSAATAIGADPRGFAIAVAITASVDFLTPFGYQTNTMVYGPGGYKFTDYMRLGAPITFVVLIILLIGIPLFW